jgi:hypothetical protein
MPLERVERVSRRRFLTATATGLAGVWALPARAAEKKPQTKPTSDDAIERGLQWLKRTQAQDGHWEATGGQYKVAMTALAGMCFLMEGSNLKEGKYTDELNKTVTWLTAPARQQSNGLIADGSSGNFGSYIHGHGYATLFLASAYAENEDREMQQRIEKAVSQAVTFTAKAQTQKKHRQAEGKEVDVGGWGYVSAADGRNYDEGSTTVTQLQALRAAADAGIAVPTETITKAVAYLGACTTSKGGVIYSYSDANGIARAGDERVAITVAAVACSFSAKQYSGEMPKRWIKYCKDNVTVAQGRVPHDEYMNYYYAQFLYALGENRYGEMFPNEPKQQWLTWSKYREVMFPYLIEQQSKDGAWVTGYIGPVFSTAVNLTILQLEKEQLPFYRR